MVMDNISKINRKEISTYKPTVLWTEEDDALFYKYCPCVRDKWNRWRPQTQFDQIFDHQDRDFANVGGAIKILSDKVIHLMAISRTGLLLRDGDNYSIEMTYPIRFSDPDDNVAYSEALKNRTCFYCDRKSHFVFYLTPPVPKTTS